jgi:16S rRNA G966 N2-methylase RsmD
MTKLFNVAPLPFQGQKRHWVKHFSNVLKQNYDDSYVFVDLFGGSGLLANTAKHQFPAAHVVYNDFDDYHIRLRSIDNTNKLLTQLRTVLQDYPKERKITGIHRTEVINLLAKADKTTDWKTISASILFSMNYFSTFQEICKKTFYNNIRLTNYNADGYLTDVQTVKQDYKDLFKLYKNCKKSVFIIDPPYLSTDVHSYSHQRYWKLKDYLDVLKILNNINYIYFSSNKSNIIELCEWISDNLKEINPFKNVCVQTLSTRPTHNTSPYIDIMLYTKK